VIVCFTNSSAGESGNAGAECGQAQLEPGSDPAAAGTWVYHTPDVGTLDYVSRTVTISAVDGAGNRTAAPLVLSGYVDNVPPVLSAGQVASDLALGRTSAVLQGTAVDGSMAAGGPAVDVSVRVQPPDGDAFRADTARYRDTWRFDLTGALPGHYTLWVDADDAAGNRSSAGPFDVLVTCADAAVDVMALTVEPSPEGGNWLTFKPVIRNAGPAAIPAGLPFILYKPAKATGAITPTATLAAIGAVTTTLALAAGQTETLTLDWATDGIGKGNVIVAPASAEVAYADGVALCSRPETRGVTGLLEGVQLVPGWNLISPPVEPFENDIATVQRRLRAAIAPSLVTIIVSRSITRSRPARRRCARSRRGAATGCARRARSQLRCA
jgi:hypothetical protein